jgi:hypothetical protein
MSSSRIRILRVGFFSYMLSFFLTAVGPSAQPIRGYFCAAFTLVEPFQTTPLRHGGTYDGRIFEYLSVIASGWVNPLFLIYIVCVFLRLQVRSEKILKALTLVLIPFCWIVFRYEHFYPREGHIVWILGILIVLFSNELATWQSRLWQPRTRMTEKQA